MKYGRIIVSAPGPGKCPVCAVRHPIGTPHMAGSVYYIVRFLQKYGREPTEEDAAKGSGENYGTVQLDQYEGTAAR